MTPFERLVRAVEREVTGEEGNPGSGPAIALEQARLYVEATLKALPRVQAVRDVVTPDVFEFWCCGAQFGACRGHEEFDISRTAGEVLDALADLTRPPIGAKT